MALRWLWYFIRLAVYSCSGVIRFITKPGSRIIVPLAMVGLAFLLRQPLHAALTHQAQGFDPGYRPEGGFLDAGLVVLVALASVAYVISSRVLAVMLGAFPVAMRPLPPQPRLKPTDTEIKSAVVRVVVPPLPKQQSTR